MKEGTVIEISMASSMYQQLKKTDEILQSFVYLKKQNEFMQNVTELKEETAIWDRMACDSHRGLRKKTAPMK